MQLCLPVTQRALFFWEHTLPFTMREGAKKCLPGYAFLFTSCSPNDFSFLDGFFLSNWVGCAKVFTTLSMEFFLLIKANILWIKGAVRKSVYLGTKKCLLSGWNSHFQKNFFIFLGVCKSVYRPKQKCIPGCEKMMTHVSRSVYLGKQSRLPGYENMLTTLRKSDYRGMKKRLLRLRYTLLRTSWLFKIHQLIYG